MKYEITKTDNYLLVVDESDIKEGDWYYLPKTNTPHFCASKKGAVNLERSVGVRKILAHLPLEKQNLYGLDLLPTLEQGDDVAKLALEYSGDLEDTISNVSYDAYIKGYNKAREKYKYTEDDMTTAIQQAFLSGVERLEDFEKVEKMILENIQSLSQPNMPVGFECEMETKIKHIPWPKDLESKYDWELGYPDTYQIPKTTTNNLGQTQWVGRYVY